jgi:diadenosine tetraphosphate (Ap4A) HIT family hydrolase
MQSVYNMFLHMKDCIFCQIAEHKSPSHTLWEDEFHMAFLSIFPNTEAFTVVIPKKHLNSDVFQNVDESVSSLMIAAKKTAKMIEKAYPDVGRVSVMFEGLMVDHLHAKLFPLHGVDKKMWQKKTSNMENKYFEYYEGYISSHNGKRTDDKKLEFIAQKIREANK